MRPPPEGYQSQSEPAVRWQLQGLIERRASLAQRSNLKPEYETAEKTTSADSTEAGTEDGLGPKTTTVWKTASAPTPPAITRIARVGSERRTA